MENCVAGAFQPLTSSISFLDHQPYSVGEAWHANSEHCLCGGKLRGRQPTISVWHSPEHYCFFLFELSSRIAPQGCNRVCLIEFSSTPLAPSRRVACSMEMEMFWNASICFGATPHIHGHAASRQDWNSSWQELPRHAVASL
jgi:hypothetical protein